MSTPLNSRALPLVSLLLLSTLLAGCEPEGRRPGLWLQGEVVAFPSNLAFVDEHMEIAIEVSAPYGLPHSVTIWCARNGGDLYVAAANPEEKHWPNWADARPDVRLKIGERLFEARLDRVTDPSEIAEVQEAYAEKYELNANRDGFELARYWRVLPR